MSSWSESSEFVEFRPWSLSVVTGETRSLWWPTRLGEGWKSLGLVGTGGRKPVPDRKVGGRYESWFDDCGRKKSLGGWTVAGVGAGCCPERSESGNYTAGLYRDGI